MDRSGRLFSFDEGSSNTSHQATASNAAPAAPLQNYLNMRGDEVSLKLQEAARLDPDFVDVVLAADLYGIPSRALDGIGIKNGDLWRQIYSIGTGLTAEVVQHTMESDERPERATPPDKTIALKIFQSTRLASPNKTKAARLKVYDSILKEMKAFSHPSLSSHPNILKLLFIGWNVHQPYPMLATELGDYGSLDYIIRSWGPGPTVRQKRNITIDIALGLQAIHHAGITHGDLKPDNIIVFSHEDPTRQVVAKLTDFGGSDETYVAESFVKPMHFTPLWCAPEVLGKDPDIPWNSADIYSYGLVVASLWAGPESSGPRSEGKVHEEGYESQGASVLSGSVSLASDQDIEGLEYIKNLPENHPDSVMSVLKRRLTRETLPAGIDPGELFAILNPALRTYWWERPDTEELMVLISNFARTLGRIVEP